MRDFRALWRYSIARIILVLTVGGIPPGYMGSDPYRVSKSRIVLRVKAPPSMAPIRSRRPTAKVKERMAAEAVAQARLITEDANAAAGAQTKPLIDLITTLLKVMEEQQQAHSRQIEEQQQAHARQIEEQKVTLTQIFTQQVETLKAEMMAMIQTQLSNVLVPARASPSFAAIARTPPTSQPSNLPSLSSRSLTPSTMTDTLYCTIDTSGLNEEDRNKAQPGVIREAIEKEMRTGLEQDNWRCIAVTRDPRNSARIRVTCRDEAELQRVKEATQKAATPGMRILRDQLYPVKVDNAHRASVLDQDGAVRPEAAEMFGKENNVRIAKMAWLSKKDSMKAYGSMVVYVTKGSDAVRLLQEQYFHIAGESAYTSVYELRKGPMQCYNCQTIGHKAFSCKKTQVCARCAKEGHHHRDCLEEVPKCVPCGGPHESFSRNCRVLHPMQHE